MADWITTTEAVELSGYHPFYLRELLKGGKIKARKFGRTWQISLKSLQTYMETAETSGDKRRGAKSVGRGS
jgi:excisionase family DNA binding protein